MDANINPFTDICIRLTHQTDIQLSEWTKYGVDI